MLETKRFETMLANILSFTYHFRLYMRRKKGTAARGKNASFFFSEEKFNADREGEGGDVFFHCIKKQ